MKLIGHKDPSPLFIPLNAEYFDAFEDGSKGIEYRAYGPRWHEGTCYPGRKVILSRGYGKQKRLTGTIVWFSKREAAYVPNPFRQIYPDATHAACIQIAVDRKTEGESNPDENALAADFGLRMAQAFHTKNGRLLPESDVEFAGMLGVAFSLGRQSIFGEVEP